MKLNLKNKKFLIIEDQSTMRNAIREMLYSLGATQITETSNGNAAIAALKKEKFDALLCDYNLGPGKNGQQLLEEAQFRKLLSYDTIFIMVTAEQNPSMVLSAMENKPDEYLTKPFNAQQLLIRLERNWYRKEFFADIEQAVTSGNFSQAIQYCETKLLEGDKKMHSHLLKMRAQLAISVGDFAKAISIYLDVLNERDLNWAKLGLGIISYLQNQIPQAINYFHQLTEQYPMLLEAYDWLAKCYELSGNSAAAQEVLLKAAEMSPQAILRQKKLAGLADKNGQLEIAEQAYKAAIVLGKNSVHRSASDFSGLAKVYNKAKNTQSALDTLQSLRLNYVKNPEAELRAVALESEIYQQMGDEESSKQAFESLRKLTDRLGDNIPDDLRIDVIKTCHLKGEQNLANTLLKQLIINNADDDQFTAEIIEQFKDTGIVAEAQSYIHQIKQKLVEINNKGVELFKKGKFAESLKVFAEAFETMPQNKTIITNMAKILLHDLKVNGADEDKLQQTSFFIKKAVELGVGQDKIGHMRLQLEKMMNSQKKS